MKKNVLALSITAALAGFGFAGGAQAAAAAATGLALSPGGIGHMLLVPYFTVQSNNNTLINITNTDTTNGKAVKVRFRGAANSDDIFDFQVFLSPGDVWTATVSKGADGRAMLTTADNSCTKPIKANLSGLSFITARLDPTLTGDALANQTREGYVEIFNMADISATVGTAANPLYTAIKHVSSVPPCANGKSDTAWTGLDSIATDWLNLTNPTTGLMANWIIINTTDAGAWSGQATAIVATSSSAPAVAGAGNIVYWPQTGSSVGASITSWTADPLLTGGVAGTGTVAASIVAAYYDLPDMSTPYFGVGTPSNQADALSTSFATFNIINEFLTLAALNATTDWTLSMPTRRYAVALDYTSTKGTAVYNPANSRYFTSSDTSVVARQLCVNGYSTYTMDVGTWDREENQPGGQGVVISPSTPTPGLVFCGEAGVLAVNNGGSVPPSGTLKATVARSAIDNGYTAGWMSIATPGVGNGLPMLGAAFLRATAPTGTYGVTWDHRTTRVGIQ